MHEEGGPNFHHGLSYHRLADTSMEELAAAVRLRAHPTPGELFVRKIRLERYHSEKDKFSRWPVINLYKTYPDELHLLTLPGHRWIFERQLLHERKAQGLKTYFTSAENDPAIFRFSLGFIPFITENEVHVKNNKTVFTDAATHENCDIEEIISRGGHYTGAWLDFNGPLSTKKFQALVKLWGMVDHSIVITLHRKRYHTKEVGTEYDWGPLIKDTLRLPKTRFGEVNYGLYMKQITLLKHGRVVNNITQFINGRSALDFCRESNGKKDGEISGTGTG